MVIYIRPSCRKGKCDENHDLRDLLASPNGIPGMAANLPLAQPAEQHGRDDRHRQHKRDLKQWQRVQREQYEEKKPGGQRDVAFAFSGLAGIDGDAGGLGGGQGLPVPHHQRAARDKRCNQTGGSGFVRQGFDQRGECSGAEREGKNHGNGAITADTAVLHDFKHTRLVPAAAEAIGRVGKPVLMQRACHERRQADGEPPGELRRGIEARKHDNQESGGQGDQQSRGGEGTGGPAHRHARVAFEESRRDGQAAQKGEGMHDICYKIPGLHALSVAVAAFPVVPRRIRYYERRNKDRFAGKHKFPDA